jgi:ABC-2 type transport system permease protein
MCNPFAATLQQARHAVIDPSHPDAAHAAGSTAVLLVPIGIAVAVFLLGYMVFRRQAPLIAERL